MKDYFPFAKFRPVSNTTYLDTTYLDTNSSNFSFVRRSVSRSLFVVRNNFSDGKGQCQTHLGMEFTKIITQFEQFLWGVR